MVFRNAPIIQSVVIAPPCNLQANFNWVPTTTNPLRIRFQYSRWRLPTDLGSWTFGDGTVFRWAHEQSIHRQPGNIIIHSQDPYGLFAGKRADEQHAERMRERNIPKPL